MILCRETIRQSWDKKGARAAASLFIIHCQLSIITLRVFLGVLAFIFSLKRESDFTEPLPNLFLKNSPA